MNRKDRRGGRTHGKAAAAPLGGGRPMPPVDRLFSVALEHHAAGRLAQAERDFRTVLELDPRHADCLNRLGVLAHQCGHNEAGIKLIGQAIGIDDRVAEYHYNIALLYAAAGRMDEAVTHNRRAIALEPDHADAHTNLASALTMLGQVSEAVLHFRRALARRPNLPLAYNNLATALLAVGKPDEALGVVARGLAVKETDELKNLFAACLQKLESLPKIPGLRALIERAMTECWARPDDLAALVTGLAKQNDVISAWIEKTSGNPLLPPGRELLGPEGLAAIAADRLLACLMASTHICDIGLERLLTKARSAILDLATAPKGANVSDAVLNFACTLARQCFINEYVFDCGREEYDRVLALRTRLAAALNADDAVPALSLAAVAGYVPLHSLDVPPDRFNRPWPDAVTRLVVQQVYEPAEEQALRATIAPLTAMANEVSARVRQQYEENPYPRWTATPPLDMRLTFDEKIAMQFPRASFAKLRKNNVEILIAGCGSGRHAIESALTYVGANVLAIDLSLASLSYAKRRAGNLGLTNIAFGQADILALGSLGRTFDVIEAVGVLHHLRDPQEGWRVLIAMLRPGGFMRVGLYSALARQPITAARAFIAARRYEPTADGIRQCRQDILALDDGAAAKKASQSADFFTTSRCRDLLFHVEEHHTSIPAIKSFLAANNLVFLGFESPARSRYAQLYPDDMAMTDLDCWHRFEQDHPSTFAQMYQFWVQKPATPRM